MHALLFHNPTAGAGQVSRRDLMAAFRLAGLAATYCSTKSRGYAKMLTKPTDIVVIAGGDGKGAVPKQVIRFLNDPHNRALIRGVIAAGNTNFGAAYGLAGDIIAAKCHVPHLYRFEVFGTPDDVRAVNDGLDAFWRTQQQQLTA